MEKSIYEKYLQKPLTPIPDEHRKIIEKGKDIPPEGVLRFEDKDRLLDEGYLPTKTASTTSPTAELTSLA